MAPLIYFLLPLLLAIVIIINPALALFQCDKRDQATLLQVKQYFNDPPCMASWGPATDCCDWSDVGCDMQGRVWTLMVYGCALSGPIPDLFSKLSNLEELRIMENPNLSGPIPRSLAKLKSLTVIMLTGGSLSGLIPSFLCRMPKLNMVDLSSNSLTGFIPGCFGANFTYINFGKNLLTGPIPPSLMRGLQSPAALYLNDNKLTGAIPRQLANAFIGILDLSRNQLTGDASFLFGYNSGLTMINLSRNKLAFDFSRARFNDDVTDIDVSHNMITGRIPREIAKKKELNVLDVSFNRLCGPIPQGGAMNRFKPLSFAHNKCLCGPPLAPCPYSPPATEPLIELLSESES